jgi:hypothetical protein
LRCGGWRALSTFAPSAPSSVLAPNVAPLPAPCPNIRARARQVPSPLPGAPTRRHRAAPDALAKKICTPQTHPASSQKQQVVLVLGVVSPQIQQQLHPALSPKPVTPAPLYPTRPLPPTLTLPPTLHPARTHICNMWCSSSPSYRRRYRSTLIPHASSVLSRPPPSHFPPRCLFPPHICNTWCSSFGSCRRR